MTVGGKTIGNATSALSGVFHQRCVLAKCQASGMPIINKIKVVKLASLTVSQIAAQSLADNVILHWVLIVPVRYSRKFA